MSVHSDESTATDVITNDNSSASSPLDPFDLFEKATAATAQEYDFACNLCAFLDGLNVCVAVLFAISFLRGNLDIVGGA